MANNPYRDVNVERLLQIKALWLEEPRRFFMEGYAKLGDVVIGCSEESLPDDWEDPPCGTAGCLAGWANILRLGGAEAVRRPGGAYEYDLMPKLRDLAAARAWLGLEEVSRPRGASAPSYWLFDDRTPYFFSYNWPARFRRAYHDARTPAERARAGADFIDWMISQRGKDHVEEPSDD